MKINQSSKSSQSSSTNNSSINKQSHKDQYLTISSSRCAFSMALSSRLFLTFSISAYKRRAQVKILAYITMELYQGCKQYQMRHVVRLQEEGIVEVDGQLHIHMTMVSLSELFKTNGNSIIKLYYSMTLSTQKEENKLKQIRPGFTKTNFRMLQH